MWVETCRNTMVNMNQMIEIGVIREGIEFMINVRDLNGDTIYLKKRCKTKNAAETYLKKLVEKK